MKEAGGSVERVNQLVASCPDSFTTLSGDDSLTLSFMAVGAMGVISVASNVIPRQMSDLVNAALQDDYKAARAIHRRYYPLFSAFLKLDTNPVPVKTALKHMGFTNGNLRLPMVSMPAPKDAELKAALAAVGVI
jgi:4-hydroxy-tetrahydrodipicolinate synthase